jgi:hypothetical protein
MQAADSTVNPYSYFKKKTNFVPKEDGFITSVGNKEISAKYGNLTTDTKLTLYNLRTMQGMSTFLVYK